MRALQQSSGDLIVDRRAAYAATLAAERDFAAAAELIGQALDLAPGWTAGWSLYGDYLREAGQREAAIAAYRELLARDTAGMFGAELKLAALGLGTLPHGTAVGYVESLFDDYAARFENELTERLGYRAPQALAALIAATLDLRGVRQVERGLDLGCGTGLMAEVLQGRVMDFTGVDLSAAMLAQAARKGRYQRLEKAELTSFLSADTTDYDLITAADVLNYVGALDPVLLAARPRLSQHGLLAFTLERHSGREPMILQDSLRYAHNEAAVRVAVADAGLTVLDLRMTVLRHDRGVPVEGLLVLAVQDDVVSAAA